MDIFDVNLYCIIWGGLFGAALDHSSIAFWGAISGNAAKF